MNADDPNDKSALAGDYVLGLLDEESARAVEVSAARDPELAREIAAWRDRLDPLADILEPIPPGDLLWRRIETGLDVASAPTQPVAEAKPAAFWRGLALASLALAATLAAILWLPPARPRALPPAGLALLSAPGSLGAGVRIEIAGDGTMTIKALTPLDAGVAHHLGLWAWPHDHKAPVLIGSVSATGGQLKYPFPIGDGTPFMITAEPDVGPAEAPGPTLFLGLLVAT